MKRINNIELKKIELDILNKITCFCKDHNLVCYLSGGTLLGAIRHKGFIPWDDDIDLNMPREDFDKLIELSKFEKLPVNLELLHCSNNKNYIYPFIKIVDNRTYFNENKNYINREYGVWVDIFPMDNYSNSYLLSKIFSLIIKFLIKLLFLGSQKIEKYKNNYYKILMIIPLFFTRLYTSNRIANNINNISKLFFNKKSNYIGCKVWGYGIKERFISDGYYIPVKVQFENLFFDAPSNYDLYLKALFGNYMELPPISERTNHNIIAYWK